MSTPAGEAKLFEATSGCSSESRSGYPQLNSTRSGVAFPKPASLPPWLCRSGEVTEL
jgi:hypothetical protein